MCVNGDIPDSRIWGNYEIKNFFSYFGHELKIKASVILEYVINNQEHAKNKYEQHSRISRTFKQIQGI